MSILDQPVISESLIVISDNIPVENKQDLLESKLSNLENLDSQFQIKVKYLYFLEYDGSFDDIKKLL